MYDSFITSVNNQKTTMEWMDLIVHNMSNMYTPGYKEVQGNFKSFMDGASIDELPIDASKQGKSMPGTSPSNLFLEGKGFFVTKSTDGKTVYRRLGDFSFDGDGVYKTADGANVQGYILNDNGEAMASSSTQKSDPNTASPSSGGPAMMPTTDIKLWIDPSNGKYLGKYDEYQIKEDGVLYGKSDKGKTMVPLYKVAIMNFNNPSGLNQIKDQCYVESNESGKPVLGSGEVRSGLLESGNSDFKNNVAYLQQAKMQLEVTNKLIQTNKQLLSEIVQLLG